MVTDYFFVIKSENQYTMKGNRKYFVD